ncbi:MAG: HAD family hydrolase [Aliiglaciecola sp.]
MIKSFLFDWGDTLMVDYVDQSGKMCDWTEVKAVDGAHEVLALLSQHSRIYVATNAADSSEQDIQKAFKRVKLDQFISGYFCHGNIGVCKQSGEFYTRVAKALGEKPESLVMVGDSFNNDVQAALDAGLKAIWLNALDCHSNIKGRYKQIKTLPELITLAV